MPTIDIPAGRLAYRVAGPDDSTAPAVVFVHGVLVNGSLWHGVQDILAARGVRSYALDLPLGSHTVPIGDGADRTPRGVARMIIDAIGALGLDDVTLVGNDSGGALCQFVLDTDATRIGRLVLTNCDAFEQFPPPPFGVLMAVGRRPGRLRLFMRQARPRFVRHSVLAYGGLAASRLDPQLTAGWVEPMLADRAVAEDAAAFIAAIRKDDLVEASSRLGRFDRPIRLVWGERDPFFKLALAERLVEAAPHAQLVRVPGAKTFVALDAPGRLADEIVACSTAAV
ncbi:MAG: alpha/beta fold hydrolase [Jatrophihabitans sp.]|uniref:alpha/beta fold hydrolase n=1 Tax=Jatrophihabitans sp. TaxID=1932789 RepID=UPI003F80E8EF